MQDQAIWAANALRQRGRELVAAGNWTQVAILARQATLMALQTGDDSFFNNSRHALTRRSDPVYENTSLHLATNIIEHDGALHIPHWTADPGLDNYFRYRIFAHDGGTGVVTTPTRHAAHLRRCSDVTHVWARNWFHFLFEVCLRLHAIQDLPQDTRILIDRSLLSGIYREALDALTPDLLPRMVPAGKWGQVTFDQLLVPPEIWVPSHYHKDPARHDHRKARVTAPDRAKAFFRKCWPKRPPSGRKIVLLRATDGRPRCLNEEDMITQAVTQGFEPIAPETLSFSDQVATFYDADFVLGTSGAGFANLAFCRDGTRVVALRDAESDSSTFAAVAQGLDLDFTYVDCDTYCPGPARDYGTFKVDFGVLAQALA